MRMTCFANLLVVRNPCLGPFLLVLPLGIAIPLFGPSKALRHRDNVLRDERIQASRDKTEEVRTRSGLCSFFLSECL